MYWDVGTEAEQKEKMFVCHPEFVIVTVDELQGLTEILKDKPPQQVEC